MVDADHVLRESFVRDRHEVTCPPREFGVPGAIRDTEEEFGAVGAATASSGASSGRGGGAGPGEEGFGAPGRGGRVRVSRPTAAREVPSRRAAGPVFTRTRASPCCQRSTGLLRCLALRVKPRAPRSAVTGSTSGVTSSAKATPVGTTGAGGAASPVASWRTRRGATRVHGGRPGLGLPENVVEDLEDKRSAVSGPQDVSEEPRDVEAALAREATVVAAPLQDVDRHQGASASCRKKIFSPGCPRCLWGRRRGRGCGSCPGRCRGRGGPRLRRRPGVVVRIHMATPRQRLVGDAHTEVLREVREPVQLVGRERVVVHGERETLEQTRTVSVPRPRMSSNLCRARRRLRRTPLRAPLRRPASAGTGRCSDRGPPCGPGSPRG